MKVSAMLINTVFLRLIIFISNPVGTANTENHRNTITGSKFASESLKAKSCFTKLADIPTTSTNPMIKKPNKTGGIFKYIFLFPLVIVAALYFQTLHFYILSDDRIIFEELKLQQQDNLFSATFTKPLVFNNSYYRPVPLFASLVSAKIMDGFLLNHAMSVAIFALDILLVFLLAHLLLDKLYPDMPDRKMYAAFASLVYAVHPANVESVAWISSIYDLAVTLFILLGLYIDQRVKNNALRLSGVSVCFLLACLSKESAVMFPPMLLLLRFITDGFTGIVKKNYPVCLAIAVTGLFWLLIRHQVLDHALIPSSSMNAIDNLYIHAVFVCKTIGLYLERTIAPFLMTGVFQTVTLRKPFVDFEYVLGVIAIASPIFLFLLKVNRAGIAMLIFLCALFPVSNVFIIQSAFSDINDRYLALPLALLLILASVLLAGVLHNTKRHFKIMACILVLGYSTALVSYTSSLIPHYQNSETYWSWASTAHPDKTAIRLNLVNELYRQRNYPEASLQMKKIYQQEKSFFVLVYMGRLALLQMHFSDAEQQFTESLHYAKNPDEYSSGLSYVAFSQLLQNNGKDAAVLLKMAGSDNALAKLVGYFDRCQFIANYNPTEREHAIVTNLNPMLLQEFNEVISSPYPHCKL